MTALAAPGTAGKAEVVRFDLPVVLVPRSKTVEGRGRQGIVPAGSSPGTD